MTTTAYNFDDNGTFDPFTDAASATSSREYGISLDGDFGSGTCTIERYDRTLAAWVFLASFTSESAVRLAVGIRTKFRFVLSGATNPDLNVSFWAL